MRQNIINFFIVSYGDFQIKFSLQNYNFQTIIF
jgi:hypothetical protein